MIIKHDSDILYLAEYGQTGQLGHLSQARYKRRPMGFSEFYAADPIPSLLSVAVKSQKELNSGRQTDQRDQYDQSIKRLGSISIFFVGCSY